MPTASLEQVESPLPGLHTGVILDTRYFMANGQAPSVACGNKDSSSFANTMSNLGGRN